MYAVYRLEAIKARCFIKMLFLFRYENNILQFDNTKYEYATINVNNICHQLSNKKVTFHEKLLRKVVLHVKLNWFIRRDRLIIRNYVKRNTCTCLIIL